MTGLDMIIFTVAVAAALECVVGRLARLDRKHHRPGVIVQYAGMACGCILAGSMLWQGAGIFVLDILALSVAVHLALTWEDWRRGPPPSAERGPWMDDAVPSRIDDRQT